MGGDVGVATAEDAVLASNLPHDAPNVGRAHGAALFYGCDYANVRLELVAHQARQRCVGRAGRCCLCLCLDSNAHDQGGHQGQHCVGV